ncbi:MAG: hypothetical protein WC969_06870 [Elusimicrobiota bacterium]|jgi:hypothetical protein
MQRDDGVGSWLRGNWWLLLVLFAGIGLWLFAPMAHQTGSDSVAVPSSEGVSAAEQSLRTLDASNPQGAPGSALSVEMPGQGAYARAGDGAPISSLYQSPGGAAGALIEPGAAAAAEGGTLAAALKKVGESRSAAGGWGGQPVHTGFSAPRMNLSALPSRSGGGGGSGASMAVSDRPFGLGGNPGLVESRGDGLGRIGIGPQKLGGAGGNVSLESLKGVQKASADALRGNSERAASAAARSFDATGARSASLGGAAGGGTGVGLSDNEAVPTNLKDADYANLSKKEIQPPEIKESKAVESNQDQMMQLAMMGMMMMMGGMMGPEMSQMMPMMMMSMQMLQADKVKS